MEFGLGWNPHAEEQHADAMSSLVQPVCAASDSELPPSVDPRGELSINNQLRFNSCCGNAVDKALEFDHWIETKQVVNLSARFSYLAARTVDGTNGGPDAGASISGGAMGAKRYGCLLEEQCPYWTGGFDPTLSDEMLRLASPHRAQSAVNLGTDVDAIRRFIGSGQGGVIIGIWWTTGFRDYHGGVMTHRPGGSTLGGHALAVLGYTVDGNLIIFNSHDKTYGDGGCIIIAPDVLYQELAASPFGAMGISGLPVFTKRKFSWQGAFA
jgi:hypothetical protein